MDRFLSLVTKIKRQWWRSAFQKHCTIKCVLLDNDFHADAGQLVKRAPIVLENGVWLATRVIVLRGVSIGEGSRIGAGSVVTHSIPPHTFAAGVPARVIHSLQ